MTQRDKFRKRQKRRWSGFSLIALIGLQCLFFPQPSSAVPASRGKTFGVGAIFGDPTGLTVKFPQGSNEAIDAGLAYSFGDYLLIYGDYLWHFPGALGSSPAFLSQLSPYVGVGGVVMLSGSEKSKVGLSDKDRYMGLGARVPLGVEWSPGRPPLGIFLEVVPGIGLLPGVFGFVQGGLGARFYF